MPTVTVAARFSVMRQISFAAALLMVMAAAASAATPATGTLSATNRQVSWTGGPFTSVNTTGTASAITCDASNPCDTFALTVDLPANYATTNPNDTIKIDVGWIDPTSRQDLDVYLYTSTGTFVKSAFSAADPEIIIIPAGSGTRTYNVRVAPVITTARTFVGNVSLITPGTDGILRAASYQAGGFTFAAGKQLIPSLQPTTTLAFQDVEPEVKVDIFGNIYVSAIEGVPGGIDLWKSADKGNSFTYMGQPDGAQCPAPPSCVNDAGLGGGDVSMDVSSGGYLYVSSLWLGNITMSASTSGGFAPWSVNPAAATTVSDDRQWISAYGPQIVYLSYRQVLAAGSNTTNVVFVQKSNDGGKTFGPAIATIDPAASLTTGISVRRQGNLVVDPYNGNLYTSFRPQELNGHQRAELWLLKSTNGGTTWSLSKAYQGLPGKDIGNIFPILAVDRGGNLHLAFSECDFDSATQNSSNCKIKLMSSANQGSSWLNPVVVNNGAETSYAIFPWIVAGSAGVVDVSWYGADKNVVTDSTKAANWNLYFAQVGDAMSASPTIAQSLVASKIHDKEICLKGGACGTGNRKLAEYYQITLDPEGNANFAYSDTFHNADTAGNARTWFTRQTAGSSAYVPPAPPEPATFAPNFFVDTTGRTGVEPGIKVDSGNNLYINAIGVSGTGSGPGVWKSSNAGASFSFLGKFANGSGQHGGDGDLVTITKLTPSSSPDVAYLADLGLSTIHIGKSTDGTTFPAAPGASAEASVSTDRMWFAWDRRPNSITPAQCDTIVYLNDHELATEEMRVNRSTNDGPWVPASAMTDPEIHDTIPNTNPGPVFVDRKTHTVYTVFGAAHPRTNAVKPPFGNLLDLWIAVSTDGGATYTNYPVFRGLFDSPPTAPTAVKTWGTNSANIFPVADVDSAGNVYVAWSMNNARTNAYDIWYVVSRDQGKNFYGPFQVNQDVGAHVFPWMAAGDRGKLDVVWYGTSTAGDPNSLPAGTVWNLFFTQSMNAADRDASFRQVQAGDHVMHKGSIGTGGLAGQLLGADRTLADFFQVALDTNGMAHIAYTDNGAGGSSKISYARQNGGPSAGQAMTFVPLACANAAGLVSITSISPASVCQGGSNFNLAVDGSGFVAGSVVQLDNSPRSTTFVSSTRLTAAITASDIAAAGSRAIKVVNPDNSASNSVTLTVTADTTAPVVTAPAALTIMQTMCPTASTGGATGATSPALASYIAAGSATDNCTQNPSRLPPQIVAVDVTDSTVFPAGTTTVTFRFRDNAGNTGTANSTVTVRLFGDLNLDDVVNAVDLNLMGNFLADNVSPGMPPFTAPISAADLNRDGKVDAVDLTILANYLVGNFTCLPTS